MPVLLKPATNRARLRFFTVARCELLVKRGVIAFAGAGAAEGAAVHADFAFEIYAFAALGADDAGAFETGEIFGMNFYAHPLFVE